MKDFKLPVGLLLLLCLACASRVHAQSNIAAPNDAPDFIVPARPTFSNPAEFQRAGVLQLEFGYNGNFRAPGVSAQQNTPLALRFSVNSRVLLEFDNDLITAQTLTGEPLTHSAGDVQLGIQTVLQHEHESRPGVAVSYYLKLPAASSVKGLGTGHVDHSFTALASKQLGEVTVDANAGYLLAGRTTQAGHASSFFAALAASRNLTKRMGLQGELSGFSRNDAQLGAAFGMGVVTWQANPRLVFDWGVRVGLTHFAPKVGLVAGLAVGLADLYKWKK